MKNKEVTHPSESSETLEDFARFNGTAEVGHSDTRRFTDIKNIVWSGRSVWEKQHPTFVSHSRKAFIIAPRKTGHSTLRFALAESTRLGDDWYWLDGGHTHPKYWLDEEEFWEFAEETHYEKLEDGIFQANRIVMSDDYYDEHIEEPHWQAKIDNVFKQSDDIVPEFFGSALTHWRETYPLQPQSMFWQPFIMSEYFKDWKVYLIIREPWDRFISGLITELDNGIYTPWFTDYQHQSKDLWEESYVRMKRLLLWNSAENILYGTPNGPQTDHTFTLSSWKWRGESLIDRANHFIECVPQIEWTFNEEHTNWDFDLTNVKQNGSIFLNKLKEEGLIKPEIDSGRLSHPNDWQWTNVSPPNRKNIIEEASTNDEDLKPFFDRCKEIVQEDTDSIKNHEVKFL